jgi:hypothetical protein
MTPLAILLLWTLIPSIPFVVRYYRRKGPRQAVDDVGCEPADRLASPGSHSLHAEANSAGRRYNHVA